MAREVPRVGFRQTASKPSLIRIFLTLVHAFLRRAEDSSEFRASGEDLCRSRTEGKHTWHASGSKPSEDQQSAWREHWRWPSVEILTLQPGTEHREGPDCWGRGCEERGRGSGRRRQSNQREGGEEKLDGRPEGAGHGEGVGIRNQEPPPEKLTKAEQPPHPHAPTDIGEGRPPYLPHASSGRTRDMRSRLKDPGTGGRSRAGTHAGREGRRGTGKSVTGESETGRERAGGQNN
ncbi:hypothetical protein Pmani_013773 [Petrolisthes manimaculis]|uniref:Uncharacterized protein n=1 Tax=Petrolisthes manimaculis TaxID=1843537 RepID=A0AAE1UDA6_9EUCA|nr:hypothetical protein Pmani_013773 [Petrolisthes manimaculis]